MLVPNGPCHVRDTLAELAMTAPKRLGFISLQCQWFELCLVL